MDSNMYYSIYEQKSNDDLKALISDADDTDNAKAFAIKILTDRGIPTEEYRNTEQASNTKPSSNKGATITQDRYRTGIYRFFAMVIDGLVISLLAWLLKFPLNINSGILFVLVAIIELALPYAYSIILHANIGQTIGKMAMGVKVFNKDEQRPIGYGRALLRDIVPLTLLMFVQFMAFYEPSEKIDVVFYISTVMGLFLFTWSILELITMLFNAKRRAFHDYIAGTVVLKVKR